MAPSSPTPSSPTREWKSLWSMDIIRGTGCADGDLRLETTGYVCVDGSFPSQPHSPAHILILDTDVVVGGGEVDPALRMFVRNYSPSRIRGEWHPQVEAEPEDPGLTEAEFKKAMKKMRKHVHNPIHPRRRGWIRRGLFSSRSAADGEAEDERQEEESKDCAVCLETFGADEQVTMTPCNHMFHDGCIVPWVKSRGQCPVCRLELCERSQQDRRRRRRRRQRENTALAAPSGGGNADGAGWDDELSHLIRAMAAAFNWRQASTSV